MAEEEPRSFWGKLAAVTAFLGAAAALGGVLSKCGETDRTLAPTAVVSPQAPATNAPAVTVPVPVPVYVPTPAYSPAAGTYCCDTAGQRRCPLATPLVIGSGCFCPYQGGGLVCG